MIAVMTSPREGGVSYLDAVLADVDSSATSANRVVVSDTLSYRPAVHAGWRLVNFERPVPGRENRFALWRCLGLAAEAGEDLVVLEDDIRLCRNAAWYMERFDLPKGVDMMSFYAPFGANVPDGVWRARMHIFMFGQALKFPATKARELASRYEEMCGDPRRGGSDAVLQLFGERLGWTYGVHYPSLVEHVGAVSAVGNGDLTEERKAASFLGLAFDAQGLRPFMYD